jgi:hypothetical protein
MSKHTPGPWLYRAKSDSVHKPPAEQPYQFGDLIFRFHDECGPNNEDLALILAAPELLEALRSIADCCDEEHAARDYASRQAEIRGIARAAIAKTEGQ